MARTENLSRLATRVIGVPSRLVRLIEIAIVDVGMHAELMHSSGL
jgi:hypothetical protein